MTPVPAFPFPSRRRCRAAIPARLRVPLAGRFPLSTFRFHFPAAVSPLCASDPAPWPTAPAGDDYTHASLRCYQQELTARYG